MIRIRYSISGTDEVHVITFDSVSEAASHLIGIWAFGHLFDITATPRVLGALALACVPA